MLKSSKTSRTELAVEDFILAVAHDQCCTPESNLLVTELPLAVFAATEVVFSSVDFGDGRRSSHRTSCWCHEVLDRTMRRPGTYKLPISTHWPPRSEVSSQVEALRVSLQVSFQAHSGHGLGTLPLNETSGLAKLSEDRHEGQYNLRQST